ncbi:MAG: hypothetical protein RLZZ337_310 [Bacteroidota bacterium]|jgi:photosystem II stability/assembly factor-like uncharacterized protein
MRYITFPFLLLGLLCFGQKTSIDSLNLSGIKLRSIGPAFMTGRIADVAIDPQNESHYYVGVGSGGVWETKNSGISFSPIFDGQKVYSIGCITIDPSNSNTIYVGTGENVGGRHISFGDGIYRSTNGGKAWENIGLKESEHISKIIVHPTQPNIIWVAAQGPLWNEGGERGVFMTTDGGKKWKQVLGDKDWTGATDLLIDPRNPDVLYAATWQRHRTVASYLGGGPKSGIHKSTDGGLTWTELKSGLPGGPMGKIGLAISPQKPDVLYAAIELNHRTGGVYRTENQGATWVKMSDAVGGATGPHYYQEVYASPHQFDRIYLANIYLLCSDDGGKTFKSVEKDHKHVDNHTVVFRPNNPDYLMVGTDGGLYESFDLGDNWRHMSNLPITQFYKLALDDASPFYNIYGGTQDNNTQGGPSRTDDAGGITNADWRVVLGGDGHQPATEPGNPSIVYAQSQQGYFSRVDVSTGERVFIQPQPAEGEGFERFNWDAPILVSPHNPKQIYVASHRLWRSNDRGDSWTALSGDLTRNEERFELPIMGRVQSFDNPYDVYAMSTYNTITSISESPKQRDLIYIGTDDGLIQITEDGGKSWSETNVKTLPGVPERVYVNDIKADLHDANTVYLALDNHKTGDYKPYLFVSTNKGKSWKSIANNLPENNYVWRIVQDHVNPKLLFVGTEFGLFTSLDAGEHWLPLKTGLPTISIRDLAIQKRENDLVAASFGRSFYVLDDYSFLRNVTEDIIENEANLFPVRDAYTYVPKRSGKGNNSSLGAEFVGENPEFGALLTYYIKDNFEAPSSVRAKKEKDLNKKESDVPFPGWDALEAEKNESKPQFWMVIKNSDDVVVNKFMVPSTKGFHRIAWDLHESWQTPVRKYEKLEGNDARGFLVEPGIYKASLVKVMEGTVDWSSPMQSFEVKPLHEGAIPKIAKEDRQAFYTRYTAAQTDRSVLQNKLNEQKRLAEAMRVALKRASTELGGVDADLVAIQKQFIAIDRSMNGYSIKDKVGEKNKPTLNDRIGAAGGVTWGSTYGPTKTAIESLDIAEKEMSIIKGQLSEIAVKLTAISAELEALGAPIILGND